MDLTFVSFMSHLSSVPFALTFLLVMAVVFVNGWTDAPNAIATCVSTRCMSAKKSVFMAAVFNFLGVLVMTAINSSVAATIFSMVNVEVIQAANNENALMIAMCAGLVSIVIWATAAWYFGIPTSESHALIAGVSGSAVAMAGFGALDGNSWILVLFGLLLSTVLGFFSGYVFVKVIGWIFRNSNRDKADKIFTYSEIGGGAAMAFMHGAQDGQKFLGVMVLGMVIANGDGAAEVKFTATLWMILLVSIVMGVGTSIGGYRIIKAVGMDMVKLQKYQGFSADLAATFCLLFATLFKGIPVSTTHTKTTSIMGVGAAKRISAVDWGIVKEMGTAWFLTFPGCGLLAYLITKLAMVVF